MQCFDNPVLLQGDQDTEESQKLVIRFEFCGTASTCVKLSTAQEYMSGKAVLLLTNERAVVAMNSDPGKEASEEFSILQTSRVFWAPVSTLTRTEQRYRLSSDEAVSSDGTITALNSIRSMGTSALELATN